MATTQETLQISSIVPSFTAQRVRSRSWQAASRLTSVSWSSPSGAGGTFRSSFALRPTDREAAGSPAERNDVRDVDGLGSCPATFYASAVAAADYNFM